MHCPNCERSGMRVQETRTALDRVYRIRCCERCGHRVTTHEVVAPQQAIPDRIRKPRKYRS